MAEDRLSRYRAKRSAERTLEPFGTSPSGEGAAAGRRPPRKGGLFVVQKHDARRLHYDFRLEVDGVLHSWALPRGPSFDPAEKRLAVEVEDHPLEYANFEGIIPDGNYGAGPVIVWDRGQWVPIEVEGDGLENGKLHFELRGVRLRGEWILVRTKAQGREGIASPPGKEWLLIKKQDTWASTQVPGSGRPIPAESIVSGLTIEEVADAPRVSAGITAELEALEKSGAAARRPVVVGGLEPMLAELAPAPFSSPDWMFELKYDGYRLLAGNAGQQDGQIRLFYRRGREATPLFPDVCRALGALPHPAFVVDGEVVVVDEQGRPDFHRLQKRSMLERGLDIGRAMVEFPATYFVFDLLAYGGFDLRGLPLWQRKALLQRMLPKTGTVRFSDHVDEQGAELFGQVERRGLEGLVAKRRSSPYRAGRHDDWLKVKVERSGDFVIVGYTQPKGTRSGFGGLDLACWQEDASVPEGGRLVYAGRVGSGFTEKQLVALSKQLEAMRIPGNTPPCGGPLPTERGHLWVQPVLMCEVKYLDWTDEDILRQPVFVRMRDDKEVSECQRSEPSRWMQPGLAKRGAEGEGPVAEELPDPVAAMLGPELSATPVAATEAAAAAPAAPPEPAAPALRKVPFSNLGKIYFPEHGYTKGDLIDFYRTISPWALPYLRDRPLTMTRFPDGIHGKNFFQKDAPGFAPGWLRTKRVWSEHSQREIDYFVCDDQASLLYVANLGSIPLHIWLSRISQLQQPDFCLLDLDPKGAPMKDVVKVALYIRQLCEELELPSFIKTSGQAGLHILVPLGGRFNYDQSRTLGNIMARLISDALPDIATIARTIGSRGGRVYVDFLQNRHGQTLAAPFSVRPQPGAPVSTPLLWSEVVPDLDPRAFNIRTVAARMEKLGHDPCLGVFSAEPDLARALSRLSERVAKLG
jgi:bifunctional non-homologous end joining protein LigD